MKIDKRNLLIVGLCIVLILMVWGFFNAKVQLSDLKKQFSSFELKEQKYEEEIGEKGQKIISQNQLIFTQKEAIQNNLLEIGRLKKVSAQIKYKTKILIDSVFIPFTDTLLVSDTIYPEGVIKVPKRFNLGSDFYSFNGIVNKDGVVLDSLSILNDLKITIGSKPNGFLKEPTPTVEIENTNPYIQTTSLNNVIIKEKKKWWQKKGTWFGIGFGLGATTLILISK